MRTDSTVPRELDAAERALAVLELRRKYLSYDEIGKRLGISKQACHQAYKRAIKAVAKEQKGVASQLLTRELDTLEEMRRKALEIVHDAKTEPKDRLAAIKLVTDNVVNLCRMTGISAPISVETTSTLITRDLTPAQMKQMASFINEPGAPDGSATLTSSDEE